MTSSITARSYSIDNNTLTYAGVISGSGTLTQAGTGTLKLTGDNTYTGGTTISSGTLQLGKNSTSGSIVGDVLNDGVLAIDRSDDLIFSGDISGTGALTKTRSSTLTLTGSNTYSGSTTLSNNGSTLRAGAENTFSSASAHTLANNTFLDLFGFDQTIGSLAGTGTVTNAGAAAAILTTGGDDTDTLFSGLIQDGAGATGLTKAGTGTFTLSKNNTYTGGTTINAGTLQLGNGGNSGSVLGDIIDNGVLAFNRNNNLTFGDIISGTGALSKIGTNTLTLTGDNTYTGSTTISAGTLQLGNGGTSGSIVGNVIDNGVLAINRSDTVTLGGVISGTGTLTKSGAGTLILTGENTFGGGTTINAGTLQIGNGGTTGSISGNMVDNGVFVFDRSDALTYAGNISGTGSLVKNGAGTLTLTGVNPYSGGTTINAGKLLLNNAVVPAPVVALPAAFLGGNGTIGPATIAGTLAPGFSIGTITVSGDMTFAAPGVYLVEISPTAADRTNVTGAATLAGGSVQVEAATGTYTPGATYTILNAVGGVNGTFAGLTSNLDSVFLAPALSYDANNVFLTIARNGVSFASVGETPNQIATGGAVETLGFGNVIYDTVLSLTAEQARQAFDALSGEVHASAAGVMLIDSRYVRDAIIGRLQHSFASNGSLLAAPASNVPLIVYAGLADTARDALGNEDEARPDRRGNAAPVAGALTAWGQALGAWGQLDTDGNAATLQRSLGGFITGIDATYDRMWRGGFAGGYTQSSLDVNARASSGSIDSYNLALYGGGQIGPLGVRTGAAYSLQNVGTTRTISFPGFFDRTEASYDAGTAQVFGDVGYDIRLDGAEIEPFANLAYVDVQDGGFTEAGGAAALTATDQSLAATFTTLGARGAILLNLKDGFALSAQGTLGWQHAFGDVTPQMVFAFASNDVPFTIAGVPIAKDALLVEGGLKVDAGTDVSLDVHYSGQLAPNAQDNAVTGNFQWRF